MYLGNAVLRLNLTDLRFMALQQMEDIMSKGQDSKKNVKKQPLLTAKEKKAAKAAKKSEKSIVSH